MWEPLFTALVVVVLVITLIKEWTSPSFAMLGAVIILMVVGVVDTQKALSGFSNPAMITIAALFIVAAGLERTQALYYLTGIIVGKDLKMRTSFFRIVGISGFSSIFLNNTAIVAMFTPAVLNWCKRRGFSVSYFLMPLSYVVVLGGLCSLVGTSTNLLINGLMIDHGIQEMSMFELAWFGIPALMVGILYLVLFAHRMLPMENKDFITNMVESEKKYICDVVIGENSPLINKSLEEAGLRHLHGLFLTNIERRNCLIGPVSSRERIEEGDRLIFAGKVDTLSQVLQMPGVQPAYTKHFSLEHLHSRLALYEVVISYASPLVGKTLRDVQFRSRYDAAVLAVHRPEVNLNSKLGDIVFKPGDVLLVEAEDKFYDTWRYANDFFLVAQANAKPEKPSKFTWRAVSITVGMVLAISLFNVSVPHAALLAAMLTIFSGCLSMNEAKEVIFREFNILTLVAAAFGVGFAIESSGLASLLAGTIINHFGQLPPIAFLMVLVLLTALFTEFVTNNAAAAIMFPVAMAGSELLQVDPRPLAIAVAIAASLCFITPYGYQTNLIVYGPGNYKYRDYVKLGTPLKFLMITLSVVLIPLLWPF